MSNSGWRFESFALCALAACSSGVPDEDTASLGLDGLEQHVSISPSAPSVGDALTVRSVLVNAGHATLTVSKPVNTLRLSGVGFVGDTTASQGIVDSPHSIAAGDSLVMTVHTGAITSKAGDYLFFVQHVTSPTVGVTIHLKVRAARTPR